MNQTTIKQRAVQPNQKQERRQVILDAALARFQTSSYEAVSMAAVADAAGVAKGTVYLYFKTKEELFLALQTQAFEAWFGAVDDSLYATPGPLAVQQFVQIIDNALEANPQMVRLIAILHTTLEQNIDFAAALAFKQMLAEHVRQTGALLESCLPFLGAGAGAQLLLRLHALVIGLQHMAEPAPVVAQVLNEQPDLAFFQINFHEQFRVTLQTFLSGLAAQSRGEG